MTGPLDELRRLDAARTPGEWEADGDRIIGLIHPDEPESGAVLFKYAALLDENGQGEVDAAYVVACLRLVPVLLDRLDQLEAALRNITNTADPGHARELASHALAALPSTAEETQPREATR